MLKKQRYNILMLSVGVLVHSTLIASEIQKKFEQTYYTSDSSKTMLSHSIEGLNNEQLDQFMLGKSFFRVPWVEAPSATTARDGLGPLFSANTCTSCHPNNGVSSVYNDQGNINRGYVQRLSIPSNGTKEHLHQLTLQGFISEPTYGSQISINGTQNVPFEAKPKIIYEPKIFKYKDGTIIKLQKPILGVHNQLEQLQYGKPHKQTIISNRITQSLLGVGLLEQIDDNQILANEDIEDSDNDGISGKANRVYSLVTKKEAIGRYTWKASAPSILEQTANAAYNDMSLSSPLIPKENCTDTQIQCQEAPQGDALRAGTAFDLPQQRLQAISFYLKNLKVPKSVITQKEGEKLFKTIGCAKCHIPSFTIKNGAIIKPYTDMLLHDMGKELADGRVEFLANGNEWRTAPLWGIGKREVTLGKKPQFLHDGRAKTIEEAILWHGGEATKAKEKFTQLNKQQRKKIIQFIKEL